jgi:hypothetical protein
VFVDNLQRVLPHTLRNRQTSSGNESRPLDEFFPRDPVRVRISSVEPEDHQVRDFVTNDFVEVANEVTCQEKDAQAD